MSTEPSTKPLFELAKDEGGNKTVIVSYDPRLEPLISLVRSQAMSQVYQAAYVRAKVTYEQSHREQMEHHGGEAWYWREMAEHFARELGSKHFELYLDSVVHHSNQEGTNPIDSFDPVI